MNKAVIFSHCVNLGHRFHALSLVLDMLNIYKPSSRTEVSPHLGRQVFLRCSYPFISEPLKPQSHWACDLVTTEKCWSRG